MPDFKHLKVGDQVTRLISNTIPVRMVVTKVDDTLITCNMVEKPNPSPEASAFLKALTGKTTFELGPIPDDSPDLWTFDRETGAEVDEELRWGPKHGVTGSYLIRTDD